MINILEKVAFRQDKYGMGLYFVKGKSTTNVSFVNNKASFGGLEFCLNIDDRDNLLKISIDIVAHNDLDYDICGFRLGIDTYMDKYPDWDNKMFPTALRCERNGFWGCFISPTGVMLAIASPSEIVSWKNEYNTSGGDVGHRIYTSGIEFASNIKQPSRHFKRSRIIKCDKLHYEIFMTIADDKDGVYDFVKKYANIEIPRITDFVVERDKTKLDYGRHIISLDGQAETSVYVRHDWQYYMDMARKNAEICQQKPGTHVESWYGLYTLVAYAKLISDAKYTRYVVDRFDEVFNVLVSFDGKIKFKSKAHPYRLQNISGMVSLLADMYELTCNEKYLEYADDLAEWLMSLQVDDGSYRSHGTHYTCVIYPAKSMLELAIVEKSIGRIDKYKLHFASASRAINNLADLLDNIGTEGQMTFEDGMITCEVLQLAYYALMDDCEDKERFIQAAELIMNKHKCLEQNIIPDCRTYGATLRFWEARYDINFKANMLNTPHGWTSWKNYATYYLYLLTGKLEYLVDTFNTMGACMQMIDDTGQLNWSFVQDPYIIGCKMIESKSRFPKFKDTVVGEEYLPMVSDWYRQKSNKLVFQYMKSIELKWLFNGDYGGSCDNDVHEHFKCLDETLMRKSFIHFESNKAITMYNCYNDNGVYMTHDSIVDTYIVRANCEQTVNIRGHIYELKIGINVIKI